MSVNHIQAKTKQDTKLRLNGLWQYDFGQVLMVEGLDLPEHVQVHFAIITKRCGDQVPAYRIMATVIDGVLSVGIPDEMLVNNDTKRNYNIHAYVYEIDSDSGESIAEIVMPVRVRPKPDDYIPPEEEYSLVNEVTALANSASVTLSEAQSAVAVANEAIEVFSNFEEEDPTMEAISIEELIHILRV